MRSYTAILLVIVAVSADKPSTDKSQDKRELPSDSATSRPFYASPSSPQSPTATYATPSPVYKNAQNYLAAKQNALPYQLSFAPQQTAVRYVAAPASPEYVYSHQPQPQPQQQVEYAAVPAGEYSREYSQPSAAKYVSVPASAKSAPPQHIQYSPASEVSSFKFSSPLVTYSNLGVLSQVSGKLGASAAQASAPVPAAPQKIQYSAAPQNQIVYAAAPSQQSYAVPQQQIQYVTAPQPQPQHQHQRLLFAPASASASPKLVYSAAPQPQYITLSPQEYAALAQQQGFQQEAAYSGKSAPQSQAAQQPQYAYVTADSPQGSHSVPQPAYASAPAQYRLLVAGPNEGYYQN